MQKKKKCNCISTTTFFVVNIFEFKIVIFKLTFIFFFHRVEFFSRFRSMSFFFFFITTTSDFRFFRFFFLLTTIDFLDNLTNTNFVLFTNLFDFDEISKNLIYYFIDVISFFVFDRTNVTIFKHVEKNSNIKK